MIEKRKLGKSELISESEFSSNEKSTRINDILNKEICTDVVTVSIVEKIDNNIKVGNVKQLKVNLNEDDQSINNKFVKDLEDILKSKLNIVFIHRVDEKEVNSKTLNYYVIMDDLKKHNLIYFKLNFEKYDSKMINNIY